LVIFLLKDSETNFLQKRDPNSVQNSKLSSSKFEPPDFKDHLKRSPAPFKSFFYRDFYIQKFSLKGNSSVFQNSKKKNTFLKVIEILNKSERLD